MGNEIARIVPSTTEVAIYTLLAAAIASAVFILGGRPYWHVALVVLAAFIIIVLSAVISRRTPNSDRPGSPASAADVPSPPTSAADSRRGRRRRK